MDIRDLVVGDKLYHKHHHKPVTVTSIHIDHTHPSLLEPINPKVKINTHDHTRDSRV
jgi:hypothetical protein